MTIHKSLLYPYILCYAHNYPIYWKDIFTDLAYGISPFDYYIQNHILFSCRTNVSFNLEHKKNLNELYAYITHDSNISENDKNMIKITNTLVHIAQDQETGKWINVKRKSVKDLILEKHVIHNKKLYNLSLKQTKLLLTLIIICIMFKTITPSDITYSNYNIEKIVGFTFADKTFHCDRKLYNYENSLRDIIFDDNESKCMNSSWNKYLQNIIKLYTL